MLESLTNAIVRSDSLILLVVGAILLFASEFGFQVGVLHSPESRTKHQNQSGTLQGALLGILGLLLGFTFAMAVGRYDNRRHLVVEEANSIATTWLRAGFLSIPNRDVIRPALSEYIDARVQVAALKPNSDSLPVLISRCEKLQETMWHAIVAEIKIRDTESTSLFAESLNNLIDLDAKRRAAVRNHVPYSVWILLVFVSFIVCWITGYSTALGNSGRYILSMIMLPVLITVVIMIVADLDNPQHGFIKVSQQSMIDLQKTLKKHM